MSFVEPFALLLLLPAAALAAWLALTPHAGSLALPGHWHRVIEAGMQRFMAAQVLSRNRVPWLFWLVTWTLIVLGLARPVFDEGAPEDLGNLAGRVIAIDMSAKADLQQQVLLAYRILDAAPNIPTALVVATAEAFEIVPLTTDRTYFDRYLQVLSTDLMPIDGRAPAIAVIHSEQLLTRAEVAVGQVVLLTGGLPPQAEPAEADEWLRAVIVDRNEIAAWEGFSERAGAQLAGDNAIQGVIDELSGRVAAALRDSGRSGEFELRPWLLAAAAVFWLLFFRRVRGT